MKTFINLRTLIFLTLLFVQCTKEMAEVNDLLSSDIEIKLNPNGNSPLSAQINFKTKKEVKVRCQLLNTLDIEVNKNTFEEDHSISIWGLLPNTTNELELIVTDKKGNYQMVKETIHTQALPTFLPEIKITSATPQPGLYLIEFQLSNNDDYRFNPFIIDHLGNVRWYITFKESYFSTIELLDNGNLLTGNGNDIFEIDFKGLVLKQQSISPYIQHHDMIQLPNGNLLICASLENEFTIFDRLIEWDLTNSKIVNEWDLREIFDFNRKVLSNSPRDWLHTNSVWYTEKDNSITISGRHQGIANFTYEGELNWMLAPHLNWGKSGFNQDGNDVNQFLMTAINKNGVSYDKDVQKGFKAADDFDWIFGQHAAMINSKGNLISFDNGWYRHYDFENPYSRIVEYSINKEEKSVEQIWQHNKIDNENFYTPIFGDVDELGNGNLLMLAGFIEENTNRAVLQEVNPFNNQIIFEAQFYFKDELGTGNFTWGEFDYIYRAEKMPN